MKLSPSRTQLVGLLLVLAALVALALVRACDISAAGPVQTPRHTVSRGHH